MVENPEVEYFSRRMREEQEAAAHAAPVASQIHEELAKRYAGVVEAYRGGEQKES
jgi:hypothetical protein